MRIISIPSADLCLHQQIEENVNGRVIFVIEVVERCSFFRIYCRQIVLALDISKNRPIWTSISMTARVDQSFEKIINACLTHFLNTNVFNWGVSYL